MTLTRVFTVITELCPFPEFTPCEPFILFGNSVSPPPPDDIATMINIAKRTAQAANASAGDTMNKLKDINAEIKALKALNASGSPDQANIDRMLNDANMACEWTLLLS